MIIDLLADLHGHYPELDGGDLLIVAGDLTKRDTESEYIDFSMFMWDQISLNNYKKVIWIGGNHDNWVQKNVTLQNQLGGGEYLCDSGTEFEGLKIWGSPWTAWFQGINPKCTAFTLKTDEELAEKWAMIPKDTDILITHGPPFGILDEIDEVTKWGTKQFNVGSQSLLKRILEVQPKLHVFGHIHEAHGEFNYDNRIRFVNASYVDACYHPVNKPIRVIL